jgi:hypothetical protein
VKRLAAVAVLATVTTLAGLVATPAQAASLCLTYDVRVNGQGQTDSLCLPG